MQRSTSCTRRRIFVKTIAGIFSIETSSRGLYAVRFPGHYRRVHSVTPRVCKTVARETQRGQAYSGCLSPLFHKFRGMRLDLSGYTPFQLKVYAALRKVPAGKTVTYGELAKRAGYPGAARAVGTAMKKNRLPIVIPCHRVVPSSGGLGEYSAGKKWKRWLLECEKQGLAVRDSKNSESPKRVPRG